MWPLGCLWAQLDHFRKDNEGAIDLNKLLELVEQCVILAGQKLDYYFLEKGLGRRVKSSQIGHWWRYRKIRQT